MDESGLDVNRQMDKLKVEFRNQITSASNLPHAIRNGRGVSAGSVERRIRKRTS